MSNRFKLVAFIALAISSAGAALSGCGSPDDPAAIVVPGGAGSLSVSLQVGPGTRINTVQYDITGGGASFHKAGEINVAASTGISAIIDGIPGGSGYSVTLSASAIDHRPIACQGTSGFDIVPGSITPVGIHMLCHE